MHMNNESLQLTKNQICPRKKDKSAIRVFKRPDNFLCFHIFCGDGEATFPTRQGLPNCWRQVNWVEAGDGGSEIVSGVKGEEGN